MNIHKMIFVLTTTSLAGCWVISETNIRAVCRVKRHCAMYNCAAELVLYLLNIWEFVYFVWGLSPPKRRVDGGEILHADVYRPCARHMLDFMSIG